ncbi:MAG: alpha/beta fold hydrolase [Chloroflexi bacterium]|nr:alpha/beta fold hydrolase [Chloroflexota bacterium]
MTAAVREERLTVAGTRLRLWSAGTGPPLLYLHGANGAHWLPGHDLLAAHCRVLLPEHPGWGEDDLAGGLEELDDLVYFYLDLLDALDLARVHLVGHSLGGWLAAEIAVGQAHRLWTLTLVDAAGLWLDEAPLPDLFALSPAETTRLATFDPAAAEAAIAAAATPAAQAAQQRARVAFARVAWNPYLHNPRLPARLHRVHVPTLLLWGAADRVIPPAYADAYARRLPDARVVRLPECGHSPPREQPAAFARTVLEFLRERAPAAGQPT